jgi:hypothetical protein
MTGLKPHQGFAPKVNLKLELFFEKLNYLSIGATIRFKKMRQELF